MTKVTLLVGNLRPEEGGSSEAPKSPLHSPFGVDFDQRGTMFIVELEGGRVHERTPDGQIRVIAGDGSQSYRGDGGPAEQATFNGMHNLAITRDGQMLISDTWNHCVRAVDLATRRIRTVAGTGQAGAAGDGGPAAEATFNFVMCVTLDPEEKRLHIADLNNRRIREIDLATWQVRTIAGNGRRGIPQDGQQAVDSPLVDPRAVAADAEGRVYVLERGGHALRVIETDGTIRTVVGTGEKGFADGPAREAKLDSPKHICVDEQGRVYIADDGNAAIRCYDPATETVVTLLGRGHGDPKLRLKRPHGVTIEQGRLIVCDTYHDRIFALDLKP